MIQGLITTVNVFHVKNDLQTLGGRRPSQSTEKYSHRRDSNLYMIMRLPELQLQTEHKENLIYTSEND